MNRPGCQIILSLLRLLLASVLLIFLSACDGLPGPSGGSSSSSSSSSSSGELVSQIPALPENIQSPQMRLTKEEYAQTIKMAFGVENLPRFTDQADNFGSFKTYLNNAFSNVTDFSTLVGAGQQIATKLSIDLVSICDWVLSTRECVNAHLARPLQLLYRLSELPSSDIEIIEQVISGAFVEGASAEQALAAGIARALIDSRMLYQLEFGVAPPSSEGVSLTGQELANRLAFFLTSAPPDHALTVDRDKLLSNKSLIAYHAKRLSTQSSYEKRVLEFISGWLSLGQHNPRDFSRVLDSALEETRLFIKHILIDNNGTFNDLLMADYSFINKTLADHYGVPAPREDWSLYYFPQGSKRKGILTHASFLTAHGRAGRDHSIDYRGTAIFEDLFCGIAYDDRPIADREGTMSCPWCKPFIAPIGRIFDLYGNYGEVRDNLEGDKAVQKGALNIGVAIDGVYEDAVEFTSALVRSLPVKHCFVRQLYRFALGRDPALSEEESINSVLSVLESNGSFSDMIEAFTLTSSFSKVHSKPLVQACPR